MNTMRSQGRKSWLSPAVLLVLLFATYSSMADDAEKVKALYNESLAYWDFEKFTPSLAHDITEGFCQIEGIHGEESFAAILKQPSDNDLKKSAKITLSSYGSSNCPTDPLACEEGFTVAFWLSLKNSTNATRMDASNCMLLSLNDTSKSGFQVMLNVNTNTVAFQALGTQINSSEAFNATDDWIWNHLGMTWDNKTLDLKTYINGEMSDTGVVQTYPETEDSPLENQGCIYTALDNIAIWTRPLNDTEMRILRLDTFNNTKIMTTTEQETTTAEATTPDLTTTKATTTSSSTALTLSDAVSKVEGTNNTDEIVNTLKFVHEYLYDGSGNNVTDEDRKNIQSILDAMPSKIDMLDTPSEAGRVLEDYMAIVNDVLVINEQFVYKDNMLLSGLDMAFAVDRMLSAYINTASDSGKLIKNTLVDTTVAKVGAAGSDLTIKVRQCRNNCDDFDIIVVIPSGVFKDSQTNQKASVSTFYDGVSKYLPKNITGNNTAFRVASFLVGINLNRESTSELPVEITMSIRVSELNDTEAATCVFLDAKGGWSTTGVSTKTNNDKKTVECTSNHLTNFAVLVSTRDLDISETDMLVLEILTNVGLAISITCLLLTLIILNVLRQLCSTRISILKHTAAALLIAQIMFIVGASPVNTVKGMCTVVAALLHYFFLAVFCWMLIQGVQLYMKVRRALKGNIDMVYFCVFGWGFPAIVVAISVGVSHTNYNNFSGVCWISVQHGVGTLIAFIGPAYLILVINLVVLCMVMHVFLTVKVNKDKSEMDKLKSGFKAVVVMVPILGVTWFFGLFIIVSPEVVFLYLFVIFNTTQGLFMFLFHVVFNDEVKQAIVKKRNKIAASKDSNTLFSRAMKSKSGTEQTTTEATLSSGNQ